MSRARAARIAGRAALAIALAAAAGCAGSAKSPPATASAPATTAAGDVAPGAAQRRAQPHAQIDALDRQITDELARAQIAPPVLPACTGAACADAMSTPFVVPAADDPACHPAATDRCKDACTISTSICSNQQKICELANQLAGDDWAAGKCERARASCRAAHDNCCSCVI